VREVIVDTETTGLDPRRGDRIVEIGCVELNNRGLTGRHFQTYVNPERDVPEEAVRVHGLTQEFLAGYPPFAAIAAEFLAFIGDDTLVIHNAPFDMGFLNAELERTGLPALDAGRVTDTLAMARTRFPGSPASLDALCKRFGIDNSNRKQHGALLDSELLAEVYLELTGGRQQGLELSAGPAAPGAGPGGVRARQPRAPRPHAPTAVEQPAHDAFLGQIPNAIWLRKPGR